MGLLERLTSWRTKDPYWEGFANRPINDSKHDLATAIRSAHEGKVYPVKSEVPPPERMSRDLAELANFLGAARLGIVATDSAVLRPREDGHHEDEDPVTLAATHPFLIMTAVPAEYDPRTVQGMAGRVIEQKSASLCFNLAAYIRELGYHGTVRPVDPVRAAVAAGLGEIGKDGKLAVTGHGSKVYVGDGVLTDLPLVPGSPEV